MTKKMPTPRPETPIHGHAPCPWQAGSITTSPTATRVRVMVRVWTGQRPGPTEGGSQALTLYTDPESSPRRPGAFTLLLPLLLASTETRALAPSRVPKTPRNPVDSDTLGVPILFCSPEKVLGATSHPNTHSTAVSREKLGLIEPGCRPLLGQ